MKNWKLAYKITVINCTIVILIGIVCGAIYADEGFAFTLGIICLIGGLLNFLVGIIAAIASSKELSKGLLLSCGILLLLSGISCGTGFSSMNFH